MSRTISSGFRQALWAQETGEVVACLLTITHAELDAPIYISTDPTTRLTEDPVTYGTVSRGKNYSYLPVSVVLPEDATDSAPNARLELDNTDRDLINLVRAITSPANVQLELILVSNPDIVEIDFPALKIGAAQYDAQTVSFDLTIDALFTEPFPGNDFLPSGFPGLF